MVTEFLRRNQKVLQRRAGVCELQNRRGGGQGQDQQLGREADAWYISHQHPHTHQCITWGTSQEFNVAAVSFSYEPECNMWCCCRAFLCLQRLVKTIGHWDLPQDSGTVCWRKLDTWLLNQCLFRPTFTLHCVCKCFCIYLFSEPVDDYSFSHYCSSDKIKDLLVKGVVNNMTKLLLVNAIYFKGNWNEKFKEDSTVDGQFRINKVILHKDGKHWGKKQHSQFLKWLLYGFVTRVSWFGGSLVPLGGG